MNRSGISAIRRSCILICALVAGCAHNVAISYHGKSEIDPDFAKPDTIWNGKQVQVELTPSLRAEAFKYLAKSDQVLLANSIRVKGLRHDYKIAGKGTPLVIYEKNPESTPEEKHYPNGGIVLGITAVEKTRRRQLPLLKLYDSFDPTVVRSASGPDPIAADYTAPLAVLFSHARKVSGSALASFIRPDNPRFATGIYLIHPYDSNKIPILLMELSPTTALIWREPSQKR